MGPINNIKGLVSVSETGIHFHHNINLNTGSTGVEVRICGTILARRTSSFFGLVVRAEIPHAHIRKPDSPPQKDGYR